MDRAPARGRSGIGCRGALMLPLLLVVLLTVGLSHWVLVPLVHLATPLFQLDWLGWLALAVLLWLFAGA